MGTIPSKAVLGSGPYSASENESFSGSIPSTAGTGSAHGAP